MMQQEYMFGRFINMSSKLTKSLAHQQGFLFGFKLRICIFVMTIKH